MPRAEDEVTSRNILASRSTVMTALKALAFAVLGSAAGYGLGFLFLD